MLFCDIVSPYDLLTAKWVLQGGLFYPASFDTGFTLAVLPRQGREVTSIIAASLIRARPSTRL